VASIKSARRPTETFPQAESRDEKFEFVTYHTARTESIAKRKKRACKRRSDNNFTASREFSIHSLP
jgi:hypothetical protein